MKEESFAIKQLRRGFPKTKHQYVLGFDTEADAGDPFLLQVGHPGGEVVLFDVDGTTILDTLLHHLDERCNARKTNYTLFGFNLSYEYTQLFGALPEDSWGYSEIVYEADWYSLHVYNEKRFTFVIRLSGQRVIRVLDAMAFIPASLAGASEMIGAGEKDEKPPVFARSQRHEPAFIRYAEQDARLTQRLGEYVVDLHREQDVPLSLSASHFAAQVFRRRYLHDSVPNPSPELEQLGLDCYHGGKNAYYRQDPIRIERATSYDIRSAYSEAMASLPDIESGVWWPTRHISPHSIVRARIDYAGCRYRPLWGLREPASTVISTTGYELISALWCGCVTVKEVEGFELRGDTQGALWRYVQDFYDMKRYATTGAQKTAAKLFLNGLYGKFFQKVPIGKAATFDLANGTYTVHDYGEQYDYIAGGLYHPPIASLITGFVRAKIHRLEHKYRAVMTSTDGIFGYQSADPDEVGSGLGQLDYSHGSIRIWRERMYIFDSDEADHPAEDCPGGACWLGNHKVASHGFRGKVGEMAAIPLEAGIFAYDGQAMQTLRMAQRAKTRPGAFLPKEYHVTLGTAR